ncbi:hypothetical protein JHD49_05940 [Sulfurimonas sp. SAG-AH-194-C21]|nr:cache domain-containing protein [Sulfurimonas sp. SAG-AH-194-C21]MDF1883479.1 hypothetical protein [Sulfurimonas sp. SAG-AH-194-C21]
MLRKIIIAFLILLSIILISTYYVQKTLKEQKIDAIMDQLSITLENQLETHMMDDLKTAISLSKNEALIEALDNDNEDLGYILLSDILDTIELNTDIHIRAQIITKELNIFTRSWDDIYGGMPIGDSRDDLGYFKTHKEPRSSIEIGRRLGIKATVPIYKNGELLGYVEVISFFKSITEFFSTLGVDLYVLLDFKHMDTAVLMTQNLAVCQSVVANRNYNYSHIQTLQDIELKTLKLDGMMYKDNKYIFYENMYNGSSEVIGGYVFVLPERYLDYFRNPNDDISFLINVTRSSLYDVIKEDKYEKNVYDEFSADSLLYFQNVIDKEDRQIFLDEAYSKFDKYSKDELIQIMLNRKIIKKVDGRIR